MAKAQKSSKRKAKKNETSKLWHKLSRVHKIGLSIFLFALTATSLLALVPETYSATTTSPAPAESTATPYGSIGKWMIQSNGQISNWGGKKYQSKTIYEMVNVIVVDPTSTSTSASTSKLGAAMKAAGFPSRSGHSSGFKGYINNTLYSQQPTGLNAFSDAAATAQNNHGRMFGPAPKQGGGYVWSGAFSTEKPTYFLWFLTGHDYVSFNTARDALARGFVSSGQTQAASVDMGNAYNTTTVTTGDHDGKAIVVVLK